MSNGPCMCGGCDGCMRAQGWHVHDRHCWGEDGKPECGQRAYGEEETPMAPPMTQRAYRKAGGVRCPFCRGNDLEGCSFDIEAGIVSQRVTCVDCEATWTDYYRLAGYARADEEPGGADEFEAFLNTAVLDIAPPQ